MSTRENIRLIDRTHFYRQVATHKKCMSHLILGCLWGIPKSKKQDGSPVNSAALGGGFGGGLALLSLLAAAAVVYRKWKKPKVDDVNNRSNEDTDFAGTTPIAPFGEAPSSVPPAGTT